MVKGSSVDLQGAPTWAVTAAAAFACIAFLALLALLVMIGLWWRSRSAGVPPEQPEPVFSPHPSERLLEGGGFPESDDDGPTSRPPAALASAIRSVILEAVVDTSPPGDRDLVLSPPPHPRQMSWHVHLGARVSLDLVDGRTVTTRPPPTGHDWALPSGRRAGLALGDPSPPPGRETRAVRVEGCYLLLRFVAGSPSVFELTIANGAEARHRLMTEAGDLDRLSNMVREALRTAASTFGASASAMGYSPESWRAHERLWIEIAR
jgi:hypothetical protein